MFLTRIQMYKILYLIVLNITSSPCYVLATYKVALIQTVIILICINWLRHEAFWIIILLQKKNDFVSAFYLFMGLRQTTVKQIMYALQCLVVQHHKILDLFLLLTLMFSVVCGAMIAFGWWENALALLGTWMSTKNLEHCTLYQ